MTKVAFVREDAEIIAVFPEIVETRRGDVRMFTKDEGHVVGSLEWAKKQWLPNEDEYRETLDILKAVGYDDLELTTFP